jgi:hypothetical protein
MMFLAADDQPLQQPKVDELGLGGAWILAKIAQRADIPKHNTSGQVRSGVEGGADRRGQACLPTGRRGRMLSHLVLIRDQGESRALVCRMRSAGVTPRPEQSYNIAQESAEPMGFKGSGSPNFATKTLPNTKERVVPRGRKTDQESKGSPTTKPD